MDQKSKLILALIQVENISNLMHENVYEGFMTSHLLPLKYEFERQLVLLTNKNKQSKI
jgi:hypothetical protein